MTDPTIPAAPEPAATHESLLKKLEGEALKGYMNGLTIARDGIEHTSNKVIETLTTWIGDAKAKLDPAAGAAAGKPQAAPAGGGDSSPNAGVTNDDRAFLSNAIKAAGAELDASGLSFGVGYVDFVYDGVNFRALLTRTAQPVKAAA